MSSFRILMLLTVASVLTACGSTPDAPAYTFKPRMVSIRTVPAGARVTQLRPFGLKTQELGVTPILECEVEILTNANTMGASPAFQNEVFDHASNLVVLIRKPGFRARKMRLPIRGFDTNEFTVKLSR